MAPGAGRQKTADGQTPLSCSPNLSSSPLGKQKMAFPASLAASHGHVTELLQSDSPNLLCTILLYFFKKLIYLAAPGLSCST